MPTLVRRLAAGLPVCLAVVAFAPPAVGFPSSSASPVALGFGQDASLRASSFLGAPPASSSPEILGWETIPLPGASCGRGAPFKYFLNPAEEAESELLVFLMGGGACMKSGPPPTGATGVAAQLHCMAFSNFAEPNDSLHLAGAAIPFFRRTSDNPFAAANWVIVPYCTGDLHAGQMSEPFDYDPREDGNFDVVHRGGLNVMAVLDDLETRFASDTAVVLTGSSAGGFGAVYNFPRVVARWPRTVLVPDAGTAPPLSEALMAREGGSIAARWGAMELLPGYCPTEDCLVDTTRLLAAHSDRFDGADERPWLPFGYLQGQRDRTLAEYLEVSQCTYAEGLRNGFAATAGRPNLRAYLPATAEHTFLPMPAGFRSQSGVEMAGWFAAVARANGSSDLPADAVDPWVACNSAFLPRLVTPGL